MSYDLSYAAVMLYKSDEKRASDAELSYGLKGKLVLSKSGWILLHVPNALCQGAFDALNEPGAELPPGSGDAAFNAHISVIRPEELETIGGPEKITERGHEFGYTLGPVRTVAPEGWADMSKAWFIEIHSPELEALRKSYGLTARPKDNKFKFHVTFAVRRKNILRNGQPAKVEIRDIIHKPQQFFKDRYAQKSASEKRSYHPVLKTIMQSNAARRALLVGAVGAGVGGLTALLDEDEETSVLDGALIGGLVGGTIGGVSGALKDVAQWARRAVRNPDETIQQIQDTIENNPNRESKKTLRNEISHYYEKAPGGLEEAVRRAQKHQARAESMGLQPWDPRGLDRRTNVLEVDAPNLAQFPGGGGEIQGITATPGNGGDQFIVSANKGFADSPSSQATLEHELTHSGLQPTDMSQTESSRRYNRNPVLPHPSGYALPQKHWDYAATPEELKAYVAPIKRKWVQAHGRHLDSEEAAQDAIRWWQKTQAGKGNKDTVHSTMDAILPGFMSDPYGRRLLETELLKTVQSAPPAGALPSLFGKTASASPVMDSLRQAKTYSDRKQYDRKHAIVRKLMESSNKDWTVDDDTKKHKGVTHASGFKLHVPGTIIPAAVKKATDSHYLNAISQVPLNLSKGIPAYLQSIKARGDRGIQEAQNFESLSGTIASNADPAFRSQQLSKLLAGTHKPVVSHPLDKFVTQVGS